LDGEGGLKCAILLAIVEKHGDQTFPQGKGGVFRLKIYGTKSPSNIGLSPSTFSIFGFSAAFRLLFRQTFWRTEV